MGDRNLNELLKWGLANSSPQANNNNTTDPSAQPAPPPSASTPVTLKSDDGPPASTSRTGPPAPRGLPADALASLFGGPSDAQLMQESMAAITAPDVTLGSKLVAFDNLEQLIESVDNANLLAKLGLWGPLLEQLDHEDAGMRRMAAWCVGTAVQNNAPAQERLLAQGGVEKLVEMVSKGGREGEGTESKDVRKKVVFALSSAVRNYQPAMDVATRELGKSGRHEEGRKVDAGNMEAVDGVMEKLREEVSSA